MKQSSPLRDALLLQTGRVARKAIIHMATYSDSYDDVSRAFEQNAFVLELYFLGIIG
jgi:hypothetical protein